MTLLSSSSNVYDTCLLILQKRGYDLHIEGELDERGVIIATRMSYIAKKGNFQLNANNPIELLGLMAIYEYKQPVEEPKPYWWVVEGPRLESELLDNMIVITDED